MNIILLLVHFIDSFFVWSFFLAVCPAQELGSESNVMKMSFFFQMAAGLFDIRYCCCVSLDLVWPHLNSSVQEPRPIDLSRVRH